MEQIIISFMSEGIFRWQSHNQRHKMWFGQSFRLYGRQVRRQSFLPEKSGQVLQKITTHYPLRQNSTATMSCKEVSVMSDDEVISWFSSFDTVMTDCDGVLWTGGAALDGSPDMICRLKIILNARQVRATEGLSF